jgi:hypothetical protein
LVFRKARAIISNQSGAVLPSTAAGTAAGLKTAQMLAAMAM